MNKEKLKYIIKEEIKHILIEVTAKEIRGMATDPFLNIKHKSDTTPGLDYIATTREGIVVFETPSHTTEKGIIYTQKVKLLDLFKLINEFGTTLQPIEIVRKAIQGDVRIHCSDPSWLYWGFQYLGTKKGYALYNEPRAPKIRNPQLKGSVCKHLSNALRVLPFVATRITADLIKQGVFKNNANKI